MSDKRDTNVIIDGSVYTISSEEGAEYVQKIGVYINDKISRLNHSDNGKKLSTRMQNILLAINIADDYFKLKQKFDTTIDLHEDSVKEKNVKVSELEAKLVAYEEKELAYEQKIGRLENEIEHYKKELDEYIDLFEEV